MRTRSILPVVGIAATLAVGSVPANLQAFGGPLSVSLPPMARPPASARTVTAAGDICPSIPDLCMRTARLIRRVDPDAALTLGDNQYSDGALTEYLASYDRAWGTFKDITFPVPGNHEWKTPNAQGYLDYFGLKTYWYSFRVGMWRLYALDGTCSSNGGCNEGDPQYEWLEGKLAARSDRCILAYWHQPRFSSGTNHGSATNVGPLWDLLYAAGADLVLNSHEHNYERFAPQDPEGRPTASGIVQIVAGTGGSGEASYPFGEPIANSEVRLNGLGAVELRLWGRGWTERFLRPSGRVADRASGTC